MAVAPRRERPLGSRSTQRWAALAGLALTATAAAPPVLVSAKGAGAAPGEALFQTRCAVCHGPQGRGDGRLARLIRTPPPFDLTQSTASDDYLAAIIRRGGAALARSPQMPPWEEEFSDQEVEALVHYLKRLRRP